LKAQANSAKHSSFITNTGYSPIGAAMQQRQQQRR
jgi:hypothetical protein